MLIIYVTLFDLLLFTLRELDRYLNMLFLNCRKMDGHSDNDAGTLTPKNNAVVLSDNSDDSDFLPKPKKKAV